MPRELIQNLYRTIDARDWSHMRQLFCEDAVYERPGYETLIGIEAILNFYEHVRIIASGEHELTSVIANDSAGASSGLFIGKSKDGANLEERFADVYTFENGRVKTRVSYFFRPAI